MPKPPFRYMQNPISLEVWHADLRLAKRLAGYGWVRVKRVGSEWVLV